MCHSCYIYWTTNSVIFQVRYRNLCPLLCLFEPRCLAYQMRNATAEGATVCEYIVSDWLQFALTLSTHMCLVEPFSNNRQWLFPDHKRWCWISIWYKHVNLCDFKTWISALVAQQKSIFNHVPPPWNFLLSRYIYIYLIMGQSTVNLRYTK